MTKIKEKTTKSTSSDALISTKDANVKIAIPIGDYEPNKCEEEILLFWEKNKIYQSTKKTKSKKKFYFLDGPPYTSGRVHLGTAWNKPLKDMVLRYKRMNDFDVWDRAGYDMHGLPTELKVQEKLNLKHKEDIPEFGVAKFVEECRKFSLENMDVMNKDFKRLGVWMDFDNAYQPITKEFIEGTWWLVKKAHERQRLYEGEKTMHWCGHCATALSKHELEYQNVKDTSVFVKFPVRGKDKEYLIIWTTTPWTLPYNLGVMANPDIDYIKAKVEDEIWILAKALSGVLIQGVADKRFVTIEEFRGEKLLGIKYDHPFKKDISHFERIEKEHPNSFTVVLSEEYVDTSSGSGLVHMAPGCGPEDYEVGLKNGIPPFNNLDENGHLGEGMGMFTGMLAKKDDPKIIEELNKRTFLIAKTDVEHDYPFCWRCKKPVIFRTTKQWFFKIEDLKQRMRELNKSVHWVPEWAGSKQFDSWIDNLRDNGITRQRYWGSPVPIWKCESCGEVKVVGSISELKSLGAKLPDDFHRPYIDEVTFKCKCQKIMKRIPDILDVWIDAGTTSWSCLDYPQRQDLFEKYFPPDFILEGKDQIRGWFNLLFVTSMISLDRLPFKSVYMHGFVNDVLGRKMSKSLGNTISPYEVIDKYGADAFRYYMIGGTNPGLDINYNFDDLKVKFKNLHILWNLHKYVIDYATLLDINPAKLKKPKNLEIEEKFMISKLNSTIKKVTHLFDSYELNQIPWAVDSLFLELSRTYIQLTREKASGNLEDKQAFLYVTYNTLLDCLKLFSPIVPFLTEKIFLNLKEAFKLKEKSLHLFAWPSYDDSMIDYELERAFENMEGIMKAILGAREKCQLGVRWPVKNIIVETKDEKIKHTLHILREVIKTQANIKDIEVIDEFKEVKITVTPDFGKLGPDFKDKSPKIIAKLSQESSSTILHHIAKESKFIVKLDGQEYGITKEHITVKREVPADYVDSEFRQGIIYLNKKLTPELEAEGFAREFTRRVQSLRKDSGLNKADPIQLHLKADESLIKMLSNFESMIKEKVGAKIFSLSGDSVKSEYHSSEKVKGKEFEIFLDKV